MTLLPSSHEALPDRLGLGESWMLAFASHPQGIWLHQPGSLQILAANPAACRLYGHSPDAMSALRAVDLFVQPEDLPEAMGQPGQAPVSQGVWRHKTAAGREFTAQVNATWRALGDGQQACVVMVEDVSQAKETQVLLDVLLGAVPLLLFSAAADGTVTRLEGRALEEWTWPDNTMVGNHFRQLPFGAALEAALPPDGLTAATHTARIGVGGRMLDVSVRAHRVGKAVAGMVGVAVDVTDRVRDENALRVERSRHEALLDAISETGQGIVVVNLETLRVKFANSAAQRFTGRSQEELLALDSYMELVAPQVRAQHLERMAVGRITGRVPEQYETVFLHKDGSSTDAEVSVKGIMEDGALHGVAVVRDISSRKRTQAALLNAQKMESLAVLAGGVAHDFNNLMAIILGNVDMASREVALDSPLREWLRSIETAGMRAADIGQQMLAYSGKGRFVVQRLDLAALAMEMADMLRITVGRRAAVELDSSGPAFVDADASQMRQVVLNLVVNAAEAMGAAPGTISIQTSTVDASARMLDGMILGEHVSPGRYVRLAVVDTGSGMDAATQARIFDPFFTTRFTGRGLGLSAVLGIVRGHKGAIRVDTQLGHGTIMEILLPACGEDSKGADSRDAGTGRDALEQMFQEGPGAAGMLAAPLQAPLVLVADDEEGVRSVVSKILERAGYRVLVATDGREAVDLFKQHAEDVAAVILDLTMPGLSGEEALTAVRAVRPGVHALLMSGFTEDEARASPHPGAAPVFFLRKPFMPDELRERIKRMLG